MDVENNGSQSNPAAGATAEQTPAQQQLGTQAPDASKPSQEQPDLSEKLAQIAKRDRFLTQRERKIADNERQFQDRETSLKGKYSRFEGLDEIKDPVKVLSKLGYSIDDILEASLGDDNEGFKPKQPQNSREVEELRTKLKAMEDRFEKSTTDRKQDDEQRQVAYQKNIIQNLVGENAEQYPYVNQLGADAVSQVWDQVYTHLQETGEVLDYKDVIQEVENTAIGYLQKFKGIPKFKDDMGFAEQIAAAQENKEHKLAQEQEPKTQERDPWAMSEKTLTNADSSDGRLGEKFDGLDEDELLKTLASQIKWDRQE